MTWVRPSESMSVRTPSIGEAGAATPGVPLAGTLIEADPTGPGVAIGGVQAPHDAIAGRRAATTRGQPRRAAAGVTRDPGPCRCSRA